MEGPTDHDTVTTATTLISQCIQYATLKTERRIEHINQTSVAGCKIVFCILLAEMLELHTVHRMGWWPYATRIAVLAAHLQIQNDKLDKIVCAPQDPARRLPDAIKTLLTTAIAQSRCNPCKWRMRDTISVEGVDIAYVGNSLRSVIGCAECATVFSVPAYALVDHMHPESKNRALLEVALGKIVLNIYVSA